MAGPEPRRPVGRPEADERTLGERIHRHRVRAGLSRTQLAGLIGKSSSWLYKVERGVLAPPDRISILSELARVLRIEVDDLLTDVMSPAAAAAVRRAAASATERRPAGHARSRPATAPAPAVIDRRAVPSVRSRAASGPAGRRRWRVGAVVPGMAVTAAAAMIALGAVLPDDAHQATRAPVREQAAVPHAGLAAPPPSMRPVAAVLGTVAVHPPQGTAALPRPAGSRPVVSSTPSSSPACSQVAFDGDTGPMRAKGGWVHRLTVRPGGGHPQGPSATACSRRSWQRVRQAPRIESSG